MGMRVEVLYFHTLRDAAGVSAECIEVGEGATAGGVVEALVATHPRLAPHRGSIMLAVNEEWCDRTRVLAQGDTLALMPPVSGG